MSTKDEEGPSQPSIQLDAERRQRRGQLRIAGIASTAVSIVVVVMLVVIAGMRQEHMKQMPIGADELQRDHNAPGAPLSPAAASNSPAGQPNPADVPTTGTLLRAAPNSAGN